jgi:hypothetical protein
MLTPVSLHKPTGYELRNCETYQLTIARNEGALHTLNGNVLTPEQYAMHISATDVRAISSCNVSYIDLLYYRAPLNGFSINPTYGIVMKRLSRRHLSVLQDWPTFQAISLHDNTRNPIFRGLISCGTVISHWYPSNEERGEQCIIDT